MADIRLFSLTDGVDEHAVNQMQRNIKLVRYKKYGNTHLLFEMLNAPRVNPITTDEHTEKSGKSKSTEVTFRSNYAKASQAIKTLYETVRDYILSLGDDVSENELKHYTAFKKVKNIICIEGFNKSLAIQTHIDPSTVDLAPGFIEDYTKTGHHGTGSLRITLKSVEDFEKAKGLLDRAYAEN
jgi:predicted transport protein